MTAGKKPPAETKRDETLALSTVVSPSSPVSSVRNECAPKIVGLPKTQHATPAWKMMASPAAQHMENKNRLKQKPEEQRAAGLRPPASC